MAGDRGGSQTREQKFPPSYFSGGLEPVNSWRSPISWSVKSEYPRTYFLGNSIEVRGRGMMIGID